MGSKNNLIRTGPTTMPSTTPDTIFSAASFNQMHFLLRQITICNVTESVAAFSMWLSGSDPAGSPTGDMALFTNKVVQPGETLNVYFSPGIRFRYSEFLTALSSVAGALTHTLTLDSFLFDYQTEN